MINNFKKTILYIFFLLNFFFITQSHSEIIKDFKINGNERVSKETIIMFSNLKIGQKINNRILNKSLKDLYSTNYFKNVFVSSKNGFVEISVKENPIIQSVIIKGIDSNNIYENIEKVTKNLEKYPFVESKISDQVKLLKNILKSYGYYFVELETSINQNTNNTIDLVYDFNLGEIAKIKKIKFIGNKIFKDRVLRNIILSEESKFWKFITRNKFLDSNKIDLDIQRLNKFYKNRGYYNVEIKSTTAVINEKKQFEIIYNIDAGKKYYFDEIIISNYNDIPVESLNIFNEKFIDLKGEKYSQKILDNLIDDINEFTIQNDFVFINAKYDEIIKNDNKIDIVINFDELERFFVERINVLGNFITDEKVIRNSLIVDEGDPFNEILFEKSIKDIKARNIFKTVNYETRDIDDLNKEIDIKVEEKPTGEIFAGAGTGTSGSSITAGIKENNYLGIGVKLDTNLTLTDDTIKGRFSAVNPNYNNSDKSIKTEIESSSNDFMSSSGYKTSRTGLTIGTEFEQKKDLFVNLEISNFYEDLETSNSATSIIKKQEGNYIENLLKYRISLNKLNQNFQPTDGYVTHFSQTLPIYSDDIAIENSLSGSKYYSINDNLILSAKFYLKAINSLDDNVRVSKRVYVPGRLLRGFESGKIGPKDGTQYIGGNYASSLNLNSTVPNIFFENENIDLNFFVDIANVWSVDYDSSLDSNEIRSSTGIAVNWFSPIGPLTFSYAIPVTEANTDITERFRFQIGTSF